MIKLQGALKLIMERREGSTLPFISFRNNKLGAIVYLIIKLVSDYVS